MNKKILLGVLIFLLLVVAGYFLGWRFGWWWQDGIGKGEMVVINYSDDLDVPVDSVGDQSNVKIVDWQVEEVAAGLYVPWSIVFTSPERILVTERSGALRQIIDGQLKDEPLHVFTEVESLQEEGLMGMAIDPDYDNNKYLYFCLAYPKDGGYVDKVVRLSDRMEYLDEQKVLLDNIPAAIYHAGCRLKFGPDGKLYITTGDATQKYLAQDVNSLAGKILRVNSDGSIPDDNPYFGSPVWTLGHRNSQGIDWDSRGKMWASEHGPSGFDGPAGGDEINIIKKGLNYGWPFVSHEEAGEGLQSPVLVFTPAEAPAAVLFYDSDVIPQFNGNMFLAALKGEGIIRIVFDEENSEKIKYYEKLEGVDVGRVRELALSPKGDIYFTTSNVDGRGESRPGDDRVYRIVAID